MQKRCSRWSHFFSVDGVACKGLLIASASCSLVVISVNHPCAFVYNGCNVYSIEESG